MEASPIVFRPGGHSSQSLGARETGIAVNAPQRKRARAAAEFEA
jgi:hypothetical protein